MPKMVPEFLNSLYGRYLRRSFTGAGLCSQTVKLGEETTVHVWMPAAGKSAEKRSVVLIHGFGPAAMWQWRQQAKAMAPHVNLYVPDLVFFGESYTKLGERSERFQAETVAKVMEELGVEKWDVVGTSYGGMVAYNLAVMLGEERVEKVVIASSGLNMTKRSNAAMVERGGAGNIHDLMIPSTPNQLRTLMSLSIHKPPNLPDFVLTNFIKRLYSDNKKEKMELLEAITIGREDTSNISPLQQEVLIVWGEQDKIFPVELAHQLKEVISTKPVRLELIKDTSHVPQMEKPRQFNKIVMDFLMDRS